MIKMDVEYKYFLGISIPPFFNTFIYSLFVLQQNTKKLIKKDNVVEKVFVLSKTYNNFIQTIKKITNII